MNGLDCDGNEKDVIDQMLDEYCEKYNVDKEIVVNNTEWQDNDDKETFAMYLAWKGIIAPKQFQHNPNIKNSDNKTVRQYLEQNDLLIPNEWYDDQYKQKHDYKPEYVNNAIYGIIIDKPENVKPEKQYEDEWTVAMIYADQGRIPPQCWNHKPELQNIKGNTVAMLLAKNKIFNIPQQWQHNPELQNNYGNTVTMFLAQNGIIPLKEWNHDPNLKDIKRFTVAIYLAYNGIIPPQQWYHNKNIKDEYGFTVQDYLQSNNIEVPQEWKTIDCGIKDKTIVKYLSDFYEKYNTNKDTIINNPEWQDNYDKQTFAIYLSFRGIIPPEQWQHDIDMKNNQNESIRSNLYKHNYFYINNEFIKLTQDNFKQYVQTEILNDICQICLNEGQQEFIISACSHKVCLECFKEMINNQNCNNCPVCRQEQWFQLID